TPTIHTLFPYTTLFRSLDPSLVRAEAVTVDVELGGTLTTGETVTDWRRVWGRPPNLDVAVEANAEEFLDRFVERVGGLAERLVRSEEHTSELQSRGHLV